MSLVISPLHWRSFTARSKTKTKSFCPTPPSLSLFHFPFSFPFTTFPFPFPFLFVFMSNKEEYGVDLPSRQSSVGFRPATHVFFLIFFFLFVIVYCFAIVNLLFQSREFQGRLITLSLILNPKSGRWRNSDWGRMQERKGLKITPSVNFFPLLFPPFPFLPLNPSSLAPSPVAATTATTAPSLFSPSDALTQGSTPPTVPLGALPPSSLSKGYAPCQYVNHVGQEVVGQVMTHNPTRMTWSLEELRAGYAQGAKDPVSNLKNFFQSKVSKCLYF